MYNIDDNVFRQYDTVYDLKSTITVKIIEQRNRCYLLQRK